MRRLLISLRGFAMALPSVILCAAAGSACAAEPQRLEAKVQDYLETHCVDCHDGTSDKSDFRIDKLSGKVGF